MHTVGPLRTVLVVDDSASVRAQVRDSFLLDGFNFCVEAENGREAITIARDCNPDIIVLDLSMPVMNGLLAAPRLKELLPATPIILFTLHAGQAKTMNLTSLGISAVLSKDDPLDHLLSKAHELMGDSV